MGTRVVRRTVPDAGSVQRVVPVTDTNQINVPNRYTSFNVTVASVNTVATVWVPAAGKRFRMMGYTLSAASAAFGTWRQAGVASTAFQFNTPRLAPGTTISTVEGISYEAPTVTNALCIDSSVAGVVFTGTVWGSETD